MRDRQVVQRLEIKRGPVERLVPDAQCVVMAAEPFLDRTQVAAEQRRVGRQTDRALDRFRCCFLVSHTEEQNAFLVQSQRLVWRGRKNAVQDPLCLSQPPSFRELAGKLKQLIQRHRHVQRPSLVAAVALRWVVEEVVLASIDSGHVIVQVHPGYPDEPHICESHFGTVLI
jgi:hypothetical protein